MSVAVAEPRLGIGGNTPPDALTYAPDTMKALGDWLQEHPVIQSEDDAREAKKLLDRAKGCAGDIEAERDKRVRPLNEEIADINGRYKSVHNTDSKKPGTLDKIVNELKARLTDFVKTEEARRLAEADRKQREAEEAERLSLEAAQREREAIDNARAGELGVDVTQVVVEADARAAEFARAQRAAARAERESNVKVGGGWGRAASLRTTETLVLDDAMKALAIMGVSEKVTDAILSAARDYRKQHGQLPDGVRAVHERSI